MDTTTTAAPSAPGIRACANCTAAYVPRREWALYCSDRCRRAFLSRNALRGAPLAPLILAWTATRHAEQGSADAEVCRYARREITSIASGFLREDEREGRAGAVEYVRGLMKSGTLYVDRKRS